MSRHQHARNAKIAEAVRIINKRQDDAERDSIQRERDLLKKLMRPVNLYRPTASEDDQ